MHIDDDIALHALEIIEQNLDTNPQPTAESTDGFVNSASGFLVNSASGFLVNSASGFLVNSASGFLVN